MIAFTPKFTPYIDANRQVEGLFRGFSYELTLKINKYLRQLLFFLSFLKGWDQLIRVCLSCQIILKSYKTASGFIKAMVSEDVVVYVLEDITRCIGSPGTACLYRARNNVLWKFNVKPDLRTPVQDNAVLS